MVQRICTWVTYKYPEKIGDRIRTKRVNRDRHHLSAQLIYLNPFCANLRYFVLNSHSCPIEDSCANSRHIVLNSPKMDLCKSAWSCHFLSKIFFGLWRSYQQVYRARVGLGGNVFQKSNFSCGTNVGNYYRCHFITCVNSRRCALTVKLTPVQIQTIPIIP